MFPHKAGRIAKLTDLFGRRFSSAGDKGETVDVLTFVVFCLSETFFSGQEIVNLGLSLVVRGLCAPFAVLRTPAGLGVDDGTHIELVRSTGDGNLMRGGIKRLAVGHVGQPSGLGGRYVEACQYLVFDFLKCHKCMIRDSNFCILLAKSHIYHIGMQMTDLKFTSHTRKCGIVLPAPVAEAGKKGTCGLYVALFLHQVLVF